MVCHLFIVSANVNNCIILTNVDLPILDRMSLCFHGIHSPKDTFIATEYLGIPVTPLRKPPYTTDWILEQH